MPQLKCVKPLGLQPTTTDRSVIKAFLEIQKNSDDIRKELEPLYFIAAKEVKVPGGKTAVVIFVPYRQINSFRKLQARLIREFEKKFSGKHVVIIAQRKIIRKITKTNRQQHQKVPRSRTVTAVNEAILEDLVYPTEIVAKRLRVRLDSSRLLKVFLNRNDKSTVEYKLDTFAHVYHKLTGRNVQFLFPPKETTKSFSFKKRQRGPSGLKNEFGVATKPVFTGTAQPAAKKLTSIGLYRLKAAVATKRIKAQNHRAHVNKKRTSVNKKEANKKAALKAKNQKRLAKAAALAALQAAKSAKAVQPAAKTAKAAQPAKAAKVAQPAAKVAQPAAKPAKPAAKVAQPAAKPAKPAAKVAQPAAKPAKPAAKVAKPAAKVAQPAAKPAKAVKVAQPAAKAAKPAKATKTAKK